MVRCPLLDREALLPPEAAHRAGRAVTAKAQESCLRFAEGGVQGAQGAQG